MAMPEAPMYEHDRTMFGQDDVWRTGQVSAMEPETVADSEQLPAQSEFGATVLAPNAGHH